MDNRGASTLDIGDCYADPNMLEKKQTNLQPQCLRDLKVLYKQDAKCGGDSLTADTVLPLLYTNLVDLERAFVFAFLNNG